MALQEELKQQGDFLFRYRSYLPLGLLIIGLSIKIYQERFIGEANVTMISETLESTSMAFGLLGLFIRMFTVGYTPKNTSGRNTKQGQVADVLNTKGIYSLIRNPLYLGNFLMWLAIAMLTGNIWFVLLFTISFWMYYERIIYAEESFLINKFGDSYLKWTLKTPVFIPTHLNYVKPNILFSWKKVMKKEKNGLFALFLLFFIFQTVGEFAKTYILRVEENWVTIGAIVTGIIYFILKYLKRYTSILNETDR
jgi:protein-S-isoprenylcysteine O-methyltransferase Ste14